MVACIYRAPFQRPHGFSTTVLSRTAAAQPQIQADGVPPLNLSLGRIHFVVMRRLRDIRSRSTAASQLRSSRRAPLGAGERFNASQAAMLKSLRAVRPLAAGATAVYFHQPLAEFGILFNHGRMRNQYSVSKSMRVGRGGSVAQGCCLTQPSSGPAPAYRGSSA